MKAKDYKKLPKFPGVYLFRDNKNKVIYVGKAINLKNRVSSYFQKNLQNTKTAALVEKIVTIDFFEVTSDFEALLLEAKLIKQYQPFFNASLKDDKDYLYIIFTKEEFPKVTTGRKRDTEKSFSLFWSFYFSQGGERYAETSQKDFPLPYQLQTKLRKSLFVLPYRSLSRSLFREDLGG